MANPDLRHEPASIGACLDCSVERRDLGLWRDGSISFDRSIVGPGYDAARTVDGSHGDPLSVVEAKRHAAENIGLELATAVAQFADRQNMAALHPSLTQFRN